MSGVLKPFLVPANAVNTPPLIHVDNVVTISRDEKEHGYAPNTTTRYTIVFTCAQAFSTPRVVEWEYTSSADRNAEYATLRAVFGTLIDLASTNSTVSE